MKTILFDFMTLQEEFPNGGMLYTEQIFNKLIKCDVRLYGLYDSKREKYGIVEKLTVEHKIELFDIRSADLNAEITRRGIDTIFIGGAQTYNGFDLSGTSCKIFIVCHDTYYLSVGYSGVLRSRQFDWFLKNNFDRRGLKGLLRRALNPLFRAKRNREVAKENKSYRNFKKLFPLENVHIITDSEYSKYAIEYFLGIPKNEIPVFYAPLKAKASDAEKEPPQLAYLKDEKYFLMISADRPMKNAALLLSAWDKFNQKTNGEYKLVLVGNRVKTDRMNCITIHWANAADLEFLYRYAFAFVYPSVKEGFGYPPIEAAVYGTPSVCSNVTSIPEISGDMPIYFSPFYPEDLYRAMLKMTDYRDYYAEKTKKRFLEVQARQEADLENLIDLITS